VCQQQKHSSRAANYVTTLEIQLHNGQILPLPKDVSLGDWGIAVCVCITLPGRVWGAFVGQTKHSGSERAIQPKRLDKSSESTLLEGTL